MGAGDHLDGRLWRLVTHAGERGFTFDELTRAATQVDVYSLTAVVEWLAQARSSGQVEDVGFDSLPDGSGDGPRRYRGRVAWTDDATDLAVRAAGG
jgi:hypothetical protein